MSVQDIFVPRGSPFQGVASVDIPQPVAAVFDSDASIGDVVYVASDGHVDLGQANDGITATAVGMSLANVASGMAGTYQTTGVVTKSGWGLTPGAIYYLSPSAAGGMTTTYPDNSGEFVVILGNALNEDQLNLNIHYFGEN
jgi:hypothetical protein